MARVVLSFATTHAAMAAEDALREVRIALQVIPLPAWIAAHCGLAIRITDTDLGRVEAELVRRGIRVHGIHREPPVTGALDDTAEPPWE